MKIQDILQRLKIESLNKMQYQAGDVLVNTDSDLVILSATGSGKTLAYLLPLAGMLNPESDRVQAVVVVPGRELALQSHDVFHVWHVACAQCLCMVGVQLWTNIRICVRLDHKLYLLLPAGLMTT